MSDGLDGLDSHVTDRYEISKRLGKGAYGIVWKAVDRASGKTVALKKIFDAFRNQTDAQRTFREVMFLQEFGRHPNVIKLYNLLKANNDKDIYLVFEHMNTDLHSVIKKGNILKGIHVQYIMCQLFRAIRFMHSGNVLHRDLKPSNVLLDADCRVKLADFGLARSLSQPEDNLDSQYLPELTEYVATRWYRAPEILLATKNYTKGVDLWSLGCILGEMLVGKALFAGTSTINQLEQIMNAIPKPSKKDVDSIGSHYAESMLERMALRPRKSLEVILGNIPSPAMNLIFRLLIFAPHKRPTVEQCLVHPFVLQFHNPRDEPFIKYDVTLSVSDHVQLNIDQYRRKLYQLIVDKKINCKRNHYTGNDVRNEQSQPDFETTSTSSSSSSTIRPKIVNKNRKSAPIVESEFSDTDYETARLERRTSCFVERANGEAFRVSSLANSRSRPNFTDRRELQPIKDQRTRSVDVRSFAGPSKINPNFVWMENHLQRSASKGRLVKNFARKNTAKMQAAPDFGRNHGPITAGGLQALRNLGYQSVHL